ncbi:hypothetical protein ACHAXS_005974 [Conticribra weissflogii]
MQAAGRLRKLGRSQKLVLIGGNDVFSKLRDALTKPKELSCFTPEDILTWAMKNTVESNVLGLSNWADQGYFHASTYLKSPSFCITDEILELDDFYRKSFNNCAVSDIVENSRRFHLKRTGGKAKLHGEMTRIVTAIEDCVSRYGNDFSVLSSGCDEECERELEMEIEREEEQEIEIPSMDPVSEKTWDFKLLFSSNSPKKLPTPVISLKSFVQKYVKPGSMARVNWQRNIYCTKNFARTVKGRFGGPSCLNNYLRVVDFVVTFPSGDTLLVSEYEANGLLKLIWNLTKAGFLRFGKYRFQNFSFLRHATRDNDSAQIFLECKIPSRGYDLNNTAVDDLAMASLQFFSGDASYATAERKEALKSILRVAKQGENDDYCPQTHAEEMLEMRGNGNMFSYSDLEKLCVQLLCETDGS